MSSIFIQDSASTQTTAPIMSFYTGGATNFKQGGQRSRLAASSAKRSQVVGRSRGLQAIALVNARNRTRKTRLRAMGEVKGVDVGLSGTIVPSLMGTSDGIYVLNLVQMGAGSWNRVGRKIYNKSVRIKGQIQSTWIQATTTPMNAIYVRLVLVWDAQPGGTMPQKADIFGSTNQSGVEASSIYDHIRYDNMDRFRILREISYIFELTSMASTNGNIIQQAWDVDMFVQLNNLETVYSGQSQPMTIGDVSSGALYLVLLNDLESSMTMVNSTIARFRYTD